MSEVDKVIIKYGNSVSDGMKSILIAYDKVATADLVRSIKVKYNYNTKEFVWQMAKQGGYVLRGRKPYGLGTRNTKRGVTQINNRFPNITAITNWIKVKGIVPKPFAGSKRTVTLKQLSYLIARGIAIKGIKPLDFISKPMQLVDTEKFRQDIADAAVKDLKNNLK